MGIVALLVLSTAPGFAQTSPSPQSVAQQIRLAIDARCGERTTDNLLDLERLVDNEAKTLEYSSQIPNARQVIRLASSCQDKIPSCNESDFSCNDKPSTFLKDAILSSEQNLRVAFSRTEQTNLSEAAMQEEFLQAIDLCNSPHISEESTPYDLARVDITSTLKVAAGFSRYSNTSVDSYLEAMRHCAQRINSSISF